MTTTDRINVLIEENIKFAFRKDGALYLITEVTQYEVCYCDIEKPDDPWASGAYEWGDLSFSMADLLAFHEKPTPEIIEKLRLTEQDLTRIKE